MATIYTIGHGARTSHDLISILEDSGIETLVDVRAYPASRRHPQFSRDMLSKTLSRAGIAYDWQGRPLGGYRIMCAEANPDECHRLHIGDWLAGRGHRVVHLLAPGRSRDHAPDPQEDLWRDD